MPEGNDPKLAETLDAPVYEPPRRGRSLTGFYIGLGIVAALVGAAVLLYRPLRLSHAIRKLDAWPAAGAPLMNEAWGREFFICAEAAGRGNEPAMAALFRQAQHSVHVPRPVAGALGFLAQKQPDLFYRLLGRQPRDLALPVLKALELRCDEAEQLARGPDVLIARDVIRRAGLSEDAKFRQDIRQLADDLAKYERAASDEARNLAAAALDFIRERFSRELADTEPAKPQDPKP